MVSMKDIDARWIEHALTLADEAGAAGDVPVGAVLVDELGEAIGRGINTREVNADPVGHAEVNACRPPARH